MICLRPIRYKDWDDFHALFSEETIDKELPFACKMKKFECYMWFMSIVLQLRQGLVFSRAICNDDRLIGVIFLEQYNPIHKIANISFDLSSHYQGKGIGSKAVLKFCNEAFSKVNLNRINAIVRPSNIKSQNLLKNIGFTNEASLKQFVHFKGQLIDVFIFRLCKDERKSS